ncbi:hypothetical protein LTR56_005510 [Elasticomyces elasticus]|nr:hypothetical protein LTR22_017895 [Elasticomyces elasticus]KAK3651702.1 hypothetical protein LTR56_005510 [Elasticomyces elasticus]KAK4912882.1 hypothetical protein LTR49_018738 [Elasticomyces elasticus]KAK5769199.1 hypothetical protein LTS12_000550 [Elasticomyces elasticus]
MVTPGNNGDRRTSASSIEKGSHKASSFVVTCFNYVIGIAHYPVVALTTATTKVRDFAASLATRAIPFPRASVASAETPTPPAKVHPGITTTGSTPLVPVQQLTGTASRTQAGVATASSNAQSTVTARPVAAIVRQPRPPVARTTVDGYPLAPPFPAVPTTSRYPRPIRFPATFFDMSFTKSDRDRVDRYPYEIRSLPERMDSHIKLYKAMNRILEDWLIDLVSTHKYPGGTSDMIWLVEQKDGSVRSEIERVGHWLEIANHLAGRTKVLPSIIVFVTDLIATRDLVTKWYTNAQDASPPLPEECRVRRQTNTHIHFTDMLRELCGILEGAQAYRRVRFAKAIPQTN